jgi:heavy metal sensor kinase
VRRALGPLSIRTRLTVWYSGILLATLLVTSGLSYAVVRWSLLQDVDASLSLVGGVIRDSGYATAPGLEREAAIREILGPEFYDELFQLRSPEGHPGAGSRQLHNRVLPLSEYAHQAAARGQTTLETVELEPGERVRLLTMPVLGGGQLVQLVQVGISLRRTERTLGRCLKMLLALIPLSLGLAMVGGAVTARAALAPVGAMSRTARRIGAEDLSQRVATRGTRDELDHLAETLNAMLARLEAAFTQMRRFAADAAHELRTPLTAHKGQIEVALRAERSREEYRRVLQSSLEEVERLIRLADDLLVFSRVSSGVDVRRERVDLESLLLEVFDVGARLATATGVTVRLTESTQAVVLGDPAALRRAILNLVENAVKYTPAGGKVELSLACMNGSAAVGIADTGPGIDPADAERVFQPFVRLDTARARETGGTGLGLSIARSIVLAHGGALILESRPGGGCQFTIHLPLV